MGLFRRIKKSFSELSAAAVREIIVILLLLCISVALALPQYRKDGVLRQEQAFTIAGEAGTQSH